MSRKDTCRIETVISGKAMRLLSYRVDGKVKNPMSSGYKIYLYIPEDIEENLVLPLESVVIDSKVNIYDMFCHRFLIDEYNFFEKNLIIKCKAENDRVFVKIFNFGDTAYELIPGHVLVSFELINMDKLEKWQV